MLSKIKLNNTDLDVSVLCYGTNMLGTALDQDKSNEILDNFVSLGGNFIDTAASYGDWIPDIPRGASETAIGNWLKGQNRKDVVIATKGGMVDMRAGDFKNRVNAKDINDDLTASLERLGVDQIDLYWFHADNGEAPVEELMDIMFEHQDAGRIRYFGASNWASARIARANEYALIKNRTGFVASQPFWGLAIPNLEVSNKQGYILHYEADPNNARLHEAGLAYIPYASQSGGYFTKVANGEDPAEAVHGRYLNPANVGRLKAVKEVAARHGATITEVVLAYMTSQPLQTIPIFGARLPEQMNESVKAASLKLSPEELVELRA